MKKSQTKKPQVNPEELIEDTDKLLKLIDSLENLDLETINLNKLEKEVKSIEENIKKKYGKFYNEKDLPKDLDTEE